MLNQTATTQADESPHETLRSLTSFGMMSDRWDRNYEDVVAFARKHGHIRFPTTDPETRRLGTWLRLQAKRAKVTHDQKKKLDVLFSKYKVNEKPREEKDWETWKGMFEKLLAFREANGHFVVSKSDKANRKLFNWITRQRKLAKQGLLPDKRRFDLEAAGFEFECAVKYEKKASFTVQQKKNWDEMFSRLVEFRRTNGHCRVPYNYQVNPSLGRWVSTQRSHFKRGAIAKERQERLEELDFTWRMDGNARR